ncbi:hypothetical protein [Natronobiforma cellulositropha]|uniref:hypothetical protein n=1 Tax=Natronobiforma cellulositropha TaxID=1679076 RepID=UPI0021D60066|nr:hypothetical protein [Natronobiforma cellulositropha]
MNRRTFLATFPTTVLVTALAGCAVRLGLADRVEVARKVVEVTDADGETTVLVERRYDPEHGPAYAGSGYEEFVDDPDDPLRVDAATGEELSSAYASVTYGVRLCERLDAPGSCRETALFLDDFNDVTVGDVIDVRFGDETTGVVDVHERRNG